MDFHHINKIENVVIGSDLALAFQKAAVSLFNILTHVFPLCIFSICLQLLAI
jgi:hypothetical protein